jgi:flagellin-like protein
MQGSPWKGINSIIKMVNKKAISPVITTILLILVAIAAVGVVAGFIIPFVRENLRSECFDAVDQIEIDTASKYTCYYMEDGHAILNVSVKRGAKPLGIERFMITVFGEGESDTFDVKEGLLLPEELGRVRMLDGSEIIEIPKVREMKTYSLNTTLSEITSTEIAPVVSGNVQCDAADRKNIYPC